MQSKLESLKEKIKGATLDDFIYVFATSFFFISAAGIFIWTIYFVANSINAVVAKPDISEFSSTAFDMNSLYKISERLGINVAQLEKISVEPPPPLPISAVTAPSVSEVSEPVATTTEVAEKPPELDYKILSLKILNGTPINGLAKVWKGRFEKEGFGNITIGNADKRDYTGIRVNYMAESAGAMTKVGEIIVKYGGTVSTENQEGEGGGITIILGKSR